MKIDVGHSEGKEPRQQGAVKARDGGGGLGQGAAAFGGEAVALLRIANPALHQHSGKTIDKTRARRGGFHSIGMAGAEGPGGQREGGTLALVEVRA